MSQLRRLAAQYFNPDYDLDAPTPDGIVERFARNERPDAITAVVTEIDQVLATHPTEADLEELWLHRYDSYFEPEFVDMTYHQWFEHLLEILRPS